jgi:hypothetical protein
MSQENNSFSDFILGIVIVFFLHIVVLIALLPLAAINRGEFAGMHFLYIGATQFIYLIPLTIYLIIKRKYSLIQGLIVGAILTILLNSACWYYLPGLILAP